MLRGQKGEPNLEAIELVNRQKQMIRSEMHSQNLPETTKT
jgi:hypothetical protein